MSSAESLALTGDQSEENQKVIELKFGRQEPATELEAEDLLILMAVEKISKEHLDYILDMAEKYRASPRQILAAAIESHKDMSELVEAGGTLYVLGRDRRMHPLSSNESEPPAAS